MVLTLESMDEAASDNKALHHDMLRLMGEQSLAMVHELRAPLNALSAQIQLLARLLNAGGEHAYDDRLTVISAEIGRMNAMISQYLQLGQLREPRREHIMLADICSQTVQLLRSLAVSRGQQLSFSPPPALPAVYADAQRLSQVLINLIVNASDACGEGGRIKLRLSRCKQRQRIAVIDNGPGLPPERIGHIFEPYYTSKATGNGLGLPICRRILQEHGGDIQAYDLPRGGAMFVAEIPEPH